MKFYNREKELALLAEVEERARQTAQMTFVVGRRRIGKTRLLTTAYPDALYFFIAKKREALLCQEFTEEIKRKLQVPIFGQLTTFKAVFELLMELSKARSFTLIIDEFQEFNTVNPSVYSEMQDVWDRNMAGSKINLILCGSIYNMMNRIFTNAKEPLFGRATQRMTIEAFNVTTIKKITSDLFPMYTADDLLAFYSITGGVAKYVELLAQKEAFTLPKILNAIFSPYSLFLEEGRNVLIEEFGKDYGNYFSILSLIASGKTSRVEMESIMEMQIGGFLDRLENDFSIIKKIRPVLAKPNSRAVKYEIEDNFLRFWFRFIYKNRSAVEAGNLKYLKTLVRRDFNTFSGKALERYFLDKLKQSQQYNIIGTYWNRKSSVEIDIVAINEMEKQILFAEVKRQPHKINLEKLKEASAPILKQRPEYTAAYKGYSLDDM